jgi:hypothetical protein
MDAQHQTAIDQAIKWIRERFDPIGIIVTGTIIRGNPSLNSDLDIFVIHGEPYRQRIQKFFNGIPCEIFVNHANHIHRYFESDYKNNRPVSAHMLATGTVLLGGDNEEVRQIIQLAKEFSEKPLIPDDHGNTADRYRIATLFEDAADLKEKDPVTCLYFLNRTVIEAIDFLFIEAHRPLPGAKERIRQIQEFRPEAGKLVTGYFNARGLDERYAIAKMLVEMAVGATGFFEWESERS